MTKDKNNLEKTFDFMHKIENLKSTLRYNKTTTGRQESSAEHSWRLALMVYILAEELEIGIDIQRAMKLALIHDIAEALTGDIDSIEVAEGKVSKHEKESLEMEAIKDLKDTLPKSTGKEISDIWHEYNDCKTKEAKYVKALDKIETLTQLVESGYKMYDKPEHIANYANKAVKNFPELREVLKLIKRKLKKEFDKGNIEWKDEYNSLE